MSKKRFIILVVSVSVLVSYYSFAHRFIYDRMEFNCHQIGCMAGETEKVASNCGCGEVNILKLPCGGRLECKPEKENCTGGRFCGAFLPDCLSRDDCKEVDLEAAPDLYPKHSG